VGDIQDHGRHAGSRRDAEADVSGQAPALAALFDLPAGTEPTISTRVKMRETSNVYALVKADGKYYVASKEIKVTLGGCGG